jgi:hypothetical protein
MFFQDKFTSAKAAMSAAVSIKTDRIRWFFGWSEEMGNPPQFQKIKRMLLFLFLFVCLSPQTLSPDGSREDGPLLPMRAGEKKKKRNYFMSYRVIRFE